MSDRFEELREQSKIGYGLGYDMRKFYELIIQECANELDDGCDRGLLIKSILYQHFGIEQ